MASGAAWRILQGVATNNSWQFQVTKTWYVEQPGGATEFHFDRQNIGDADLRNEYPAVLNVERWLL
jgi:hypothetical protein